jgi:phospholipase/lecithinase/hemolysin
MERSSMGIPARQVVLTWFLVILFTCSFGAVAFSFDRIVSFGDSLTDDIGGAYGNNGVKYPQDSGSPYYYCDGPVWVQYLAKSLNVPLVDMAYGGAETGLADTTWGMVGDTAQWGLLWQVDQFIKSYPISLPDNTLVTIWAGVCDIYYAQYYAQHQDENPDKNDPQYIIQPNLNIATAIAALKKAGFNNFLVMNIPDLGQTPAIKYYGSAVQKQATGWCLAFNKALLQNLTSLKKANPTIKLYTLDTFVLLDVMIALPGLFGFDNVTGWQTSGDIRYKNYFSYDGSHPTTKVHALIAKAAQLKITQRLW